MRILGKASVDPGERSAQAQLVLDRFAGKVELRLPPPEVKKPGAAGRARAFSNQPVEALRRGRVEGEQMHEAGEK